jgi:hypothetical protein
MPNVNYPASIKTDYDKLVAIYSLIEQMRLEHNARLEEAKSKGVYPEYWKLFKSKLRPLLAEKDRLKSSIRGASYTDKQWKSLKPDEVAQAYVELYGDKDELKGLPTEATSGLIDQLKAVDLSKLSKTSIPDPYQDFTGYTKVDPNSEFTVTSTKVSADPFHYGKGQSYVYKDFGAGHFTNYDHLFEVAVTDHSGTGNGYGHPVWMLQNVVCDEYYMVLAGEDAHGLYAQEWGASSIYFGLREYVNGSPDADYSANIAEGTLYYIEMEREDTSLTCYIRTGSHEGSLFDTLYVTVDSQSFRYLFVMQSSDYFGDSDWMSDYVQNLDIQEGGGVTEKTSSDSGTGTDTKASGNPAVALSKSETGSGADSKGSGDPQATLMKSEAGSGVDALTSLLTTQQRAETGSGVEASYLDIAGYIAKVSSDSGHGIETGFIIVALIKGFETGNGAGALTDRELVLAESATGAELSITVVVKTTFDGGSGVEVSNVIPVFFSGDTGLGYELSMALKDIRGGDGGFSSDALKALIGAVHSGYDIRLHGRSGQVKAPSRRVRMPSKEVNI